VERAGSPVGVYRLRVAWGLVGTALSDHEDALYLALVGSADCRSGSGGWSSICGEGGYLVLFHGTDLDF